MFFLRKKVKKKERIDFDIASYMQVDIHSHFLPGIDDGAQNVEESLKLIKGITAHGIQKIITTPHIMADIHKNTPDTIKNAFTTLEPHLAEAQITVPFSYGAEYLLDELFLDKLDSGNVLPVFDNVLLVETPFLYKPLNLEDMIFRIQTAGFKPLLAHPERYYYMFNEQELFFKLKDIGVMFQMNVLAVTGYYGKMEKDTAKFILSNKMYDYFGSDMHHNRHLQNFSNFKVNEDIIELFDDNYHQIKNRELLTK